MSNTNVITATITNLLADEGLTKRDKLELTLALAVAPMVDGLLAAATEAVKELPQDIREERALSRAERSLRIRQIERDIARIGREEEEERAERARKEREALKRELRAELRAEGRRKR